MAMAAQQEVDENTQHLRLNYQVNFAQALSKAKHLRIPVQSCPQFQPNAATHSILKLPLNPVKTATH